MGFILIQYGEANRSGGHGPCKESLFLRDPRRKELAYRPRQEVQGPAVVRMGHGLEVGMWALGGWACIWKAAHGLSLLLSLGIGQPWEGPSCQGQQATDVKA